jgi:hypothetical protein
MWTPTIRQQSGLDRYVSAAPDRLFKGIPSHVRPFRLPFSTVLAILLLFLLVTCRSQYVLYLLSLSPSASTFSSFKISSFLVWSKSVHRLLLFWQIASRPMSDFYIFFLLRDQIALPYKRMETASALYTYVACVDTNSFTPTSMACPSLFTTLCTVACNASIFAVLAITSWTKMDIFHTFESEPEMM